MRIKLFKDLKKSTLTSTLTKDDILLVKKYRPAELKKQDAEGNDIFAVSYVEGHPCVSPKGITFGSKSSNGGFAMITIDLPETLAEGTYGDYIADKVGAALVYINEFETSVPRVVAAIKDERDALLNSIEEA